MVSVAICLTRSHHVPDTSGRPRNAKYSKAADAPPPPIRDRVTPRCHGSTTSTVPDTGVTPTHSTGPVAVTVTVSSTPHTGADPDHPDGEEYRAPDGWYSHPRTVTGAEVVVSPTMNATLKRPCWEADPGAVQ